MILQMINWDVEAVSQLPKITQWVGDLSGLDRTSEHSAEHCDVFFTCTVGETLPLLMLLHIPCSFWEKSGEDNV